jgi:hypothetical protein
VHTGFESKLENKEARIAVIHLPEPTAWPMVLALGATLLVAGLLTNVVVSILGAVLSVMAIVGWFRQVLPHEHHEEVLAPVPAEALEEMAALSKAMPFAHLHQEVTPLADFSIIAGVEGGLAGGLAMTVPATIYSWIKYHSLWYAVNLLAAGGFVSWSHASNEFLSQFHIEGLMAGLAIHISVSILMGLLFGAMLPMYPRKPIFTAGFMFPLLWTGLAYSTMNIISPIMNERIDWYWFIPSQIAFGLVAGFVVNLRIQVRTPEFQAKPFAERAGLHTNRGPNKRNSGKGKKP